MDDTTDRPDPRLAFLREEVGAQVDVAGDITAVGDRWAVHGTVPLGGEVILGEYDTYDEARQALADLGPAATTTPAAPIRGTVGHRDGWLVLQFDHRVRQAPDELWHALGAIDHREHGVPCGIPPGLPEASPPPMAFQWCPGLDTLRWEVDAADDGSRFAFTAWIESDDLDQAAEAGAGYHRCFEQLALVLDAACRLVPGPGVDFAALTTHYRDAFAAAVADTD